MPYKVRNNCDRCLKNLAEEGGRLCWDCSVRRVREEEAREYECPVCGASPGYACIIRKWVGGDGYWSGYYSVSQEEAVHKQRHPDYKSEDEVEIPFWKQAWHFFFGKD